MKTTILLLGFIISTASLAGQNNPQKYSDLIRKADSLYNAKEYKNSAFTFSNAFKANNWKATINERYNAACSWALANYLDSAFYNLKYITTLMNYANYGHIKSDPDFKSLYNDTRWKSLLEAIKANKVKTYPNQSLIAVNGFNVDISIAGLANNQIDKPVIVFENGIASTYNSWETVVNEVSKTHVTLNYNRPRVGESEDDSLPPTTEHIVNNLREMLLAKGLKPPYLLVGHSFGGSYIRSFASYYPNEVAGLIFVDPNDFTQKGKDGDLPYLEIGLTQHQIDSLFGKSYTEFTKIFYDEMPRFYVEEAKILKQLLQSEFKECNRNPLPDVPVHFIMAGRFPNASDRIQTLYDEERMFRINSNLKMKRWLTLLYPLKYGKFFYSSNSGHIIQNDDPDIIISSINLALNDYNRIQKEKTDNRDGLNI